MVREVLKLKTDNGNDSIALLWENDGPILWEDGSEMLLERQDGIPFKNIEITEYSFKSPRMGIPTLTAELYWPTCLDDEWTGKEFVELRGERYYIRQAQSSEISNDNVVKYKHSLDFKSEREILAHVYFYDVVPSDILDSDSEGHDKPNTNSTTFKLYGTPYEYADRLNCAFRYAGIGDSILNTKTSLRDTDVPVGDGYCVVVSGYGDGDLAQSQEFSFEDKWLWDALTEGFNKFKIPFAFHGKKIVFNEYSELISHVFKYGFDDALLSVKKNNANAKIINRITFKGSEENIPYYYPNETEYGHVQLNMLDTNSALSANDFSIVKPGRLVGRIMSGSAVTLDLAGSPNATVKSPILFDRGDGFEPFEVGKWYEIDSNADIDEYHGFTYKISFSTQYNGDVVLEKICGQTWNVDQSHPGFTEESIANNLIGQPFLRIVSLKSSDNTDYLASARIENGHIVMSDMPAGEYTLGVNISWVYEGWVYWWRINLFAFEYKNEQKYFWRCGDKKTDNLLNWGVEFTGTPSTNAVGDGFKWSGTGRIAFQTALMPPKYRETLGTERFYNALNNTYKKRDGQTYYTFKNPYVEGNPNEYIHTDETIKPTIEGVENSKGELFGVISDVAFDVDDNDSLKADVGSDEKDKNDSANYAHSFFYIRLNKFDGTYGFDLFKSASQTDPMTIQMTSGRCNGCKFKIQVIESKDGDVEVWSNPVQTLMADGDIVTGTQSQIINKDNPQPWQQDTTKNYIWIAVQKDAETFGVIMPNHSHDYIPEPGDTFNIINIDLPQGYIDAAEKRGMYAMLDFMENNNEEKFTFDITASRIFFAQNPDLLAAINENSRIKIEYDGKFYEQYVSELGINCKDGEALPDVKLLLADTLEPSGSFVEEVVAQAAGITNAVNRGGGTSAGGLTTDLADKRYLRKDKDDRSEHRISSDTAIEVGNFVSGSSGGILSVDPKTGKSSLEVDYFKARAKAIFETLEIAHVRSIGGKLTITPGGSIDISFVEELSDAYRCYFKQKEESQGAECRFSVGDDVICQSFNIANGEHQNASNKYYWRSVTAVSNEGSYVELSKTDCAPGSDAPQPGDTICQLGSDDDSRQSAIILSTIDTFSPNITLYEGVTGFTLAGKEMVEMGVDQTTHKAYFHVYGNAYIGDEDGNSYVKYDNLLKELEVKAKLNIASTVGDKPIDEYIGEVADTKLAGYSYLKKALRDVTTINGGLMLSGLIRLGENNADPNSQIVWAGHNGIYGNGRTIGSWWGGDMLDLFNDDDTVNATNKTKRHAASLVRMDGSAYFANGNIGFRKDGSGWLGNNLTGIKFGTDGSMTFGSGVKIDVTGSGGVQQTLEDVINFNVGLTNLLKPCDKDNNELTWSEATKSDGLGGIKAKSLKAKVNFWSVGGISALGEADFSGGGSGGSGSGSGSDFGLMKTWPTTNPGIGTTDALGANLGYELHTSLNSALSRITAIEPLDHINFKDTRNIATLPNSYGASVRANFKLNATNGLSDGGFFNAELYFRGYGSGDDLSGGRPHELAFTANGNIWHRIGTSTTTWGDWHKILTDNNYTSILDGSYVKKSGDSMSGTLTVPRINIPGTASSTAYISADSSSNFYFNVGGRTLLVADNGNATVRPGSSLNDVVYLGATFARWKCVYATAINVTSEVLVEHLNAGKLGGKTLSDILGSNVASATKLQTSRSIWGQAFDGTQNISGALSGVTDLTASGDIIANRLSLNGGLDFIEWDNTNNAYKVNGNLYATGGVSCLGFNYVSSSAIHADTLKCDKIYPSSGYESVCIDLSDGIRISSTNGTYIGDAVEDMEVTMLSDLYFGTTGGNRIDTSGNAFLSTVTINGAKFTVADGEVYVTIGGTKYKLTKTTV